MFIHRDCWIQLLLMLLFYSPCKIECSRRHPCTSITNSTRLKHFFSVVIHLKDATLVVVWTLLFFLTSCHIHSTRTVFPHYFLVSLWKKIEVQYLSFRSRNPFCVWYLVKMFSRVVLNGTLGTCVFFFFSYLLCVLHSMWVPHVYSQADLWGLCTNVQYLKK